MALPALKPSRLQVDARVVPGTRGPSLRRGRSGQSGGRRGRSRRRVWPATAGLALVLVALGLVCVGVVADSRATSSRVDRGLRLASAHNELQVGLRLQQEAVQRALRTTATPASRADDLGTYRAAAERVRGLATDVQQLGTAGDRALVAYVLLQQQRYASVAGEVFDALARNEPAAARTVDQTAGRDPFSGVLPLLDAADDAGRHRATAEMTSLHDRLDRAVVVLPVAFAVGFVLLGVCWGLLLLLQRDLRRAAEAHRHRAEHDVLTGLANRALFRSRAADALLAARIPVEHAGGARSVHTLAVLVLDLDGFKAVNDQYGHAAGDDLLVEVARRVGEQLRTDDLAARLGGDEFAVLLAATDLDGLALVRTRLRQVLSAPYPVAGTVVHDVGVSVGVALAARHGDTVDALLAHADGDMYADKACRRRPVALPSSGR